MDDANIAGECHVEGIWWKDGSMVLPESVNSKGLMLQAMRVHPLAGHLAVTRTLKPISSLLLGQNAVQEVRDYNPRCAGFRLHAQLHKPLTPQSQLAPHSVMARCWMSLLTLDIPLPQGDTTALPLTADGHDALAVCVDKLTRYV